VRLDWLKEYERRLITAKEAAQLVKSGDWIEYGFGINCAGILMKPWRAEKMNYMM
jgi:acyl-CoA hydrolase